MQKIFIIHGAYGNPQENWFPWLKDSLERLGCKVFVPAFPTPKGQTLDNWLAAFKGIEGELDEHSILVGHSLGATFILDLLQTIDKEVKSVFLVSAFITPANDPNNELTEINRTFYENGFDFDKIKKNVSDIHVINSDNDPYVGLDMAENVATSLDVEVTLIRGAGHFNKAAGFTQFPQLLDMIKRSLES